MQLDDTGPNAFSESREVSRDHSHCYWRVSLDRSFDKIDSEQVCPTQSFGLPDQGQCPRSVWGSPCIFGSFLINKLYISIYPMDLSCLKMFKAQHCASFDSKDEAPNSRRYPQALHPLGPAPHLVISIAASETSFS